MSHKRCTSKPTHLYVAGRKIRAGEKAYVLKVSGEVVELKSWKELDELGQPVIVTDGSIPEAGVFYGEKPFEETWWEGYAGKTNSKGRSGRLEKPVKAQRTGMGDLYRQAWKQCMDPRSNGADSGSGDVAQLGLQGIDRDTEQHLNRIRSRDRLVKRFSWSVPNDDAIWTLASFGNIVEIGAGTGYWARLAYEQGAEVHCYDRAPTGSFDNSWHGRTHCWMPVKKGGTEKIADHPGAALLLSWPPYGDSMGSRCVQAHRDNGGQSVIYIGERNGCTGDLSLRLMFSYGYLEMEEIRLPVWEGLYDSMRVLERQEGRLPYRKMLDAIPESSYYMSMDASATETTVDEKARELEEQVMLWKAQLAQGATLGEDEIERSDNLCQGLMECYAAWLTELGETLDNKDLLSEAEATDMFIKACENFEELSYLHRWFPSSWRTLNDESLEEGSQELEKTVQRWREMEEQRLSYHNRKAQ